jgi:hypothetical protein
MAEHTYEIVVNLKGGGGGSGGGSGGGGSSNAAQKNTASPFKEALDFVRNSVVVKEITGIGKQAASFYVTNIGLTTGNSESQQQAAFNMKVISGVVGAGVALATGNYLGAALMGVHAATSLYFNQKQIDLEHRVENESLSLSRQRAGVAFNHSRMGGAE